MFMHSNYTAKHYIMLDLIVYTPCLKKVPTFQFSVALSNLKPIFKIFALLESL